MHFLIYGGLGRNLAGMRAVSHLLLRPILLSSTTLSFGNLVLASQKLSFLRKLRFQTASDGSGNSIITTEQPFSERGRCDTDFGTTAISPSRIVMLPPSAKSTAMSPSTANSTLSLYPCVCQP